MQNLELCSFSSILKSHTWRGTANYEYSLRTNY